MRVPSQCVRFPALALAVLALSLAARADQPEPSVAVVEGQITPIGYTMHTTGAAIDFVTDLDSFTFEGIAGQQVRIVLRAYNFLDPQVDLYRPGFALQTSGSCVGNSSCFVQIDATLDTTGVHTIIVFDQNADDTGSYQLQIERLPPLSAETLVYGVQSTDALHVTDTDYFTFEGVAGTLVQISLRGYNFLDPNLELFDPTGMLEWSDSCVGNSSCLITTTRALAMTGTYRLELEDTNYDDTGSYEITVHCLSANCPPSPVTYCTGKTSSSGCVPFLTTVGRASTSSTLPFELQANYLVPNEAGLFIYSPSKANLSFHGGKLCVKAPFRRWLPVKKVPNPGPAPCTGFFARDFNPRIQSAADPLLTMGATIDAQYRQRDPFDPTGFGDSLTNAVEFTIEP